MFCPVSAVPAANNSDFSMTHIRVVNAADQFQEPRFAALDAVLAMPSGC